MKRLIAATLVLVAVAPLASADDRSIGDTRLFARIGTPGMPEGIAVLDGVVYVGTHASVRGNSGEGASRIFKLDLDTGAAIGEIEITGQTVGATHGILGMAPDAEGRLYVLDRNPPRVVRVDPVSGAQETYATIPDLPACRAVIGPDAACAPVTVDEPAFPDYPAFDAAGNLYITDLQAATIFRVRPGGGEAEIWYQDPAFDGIFGLNGIAVDPSGTRLVFAMTGSQQPATPAQGIIHSLPIVESPSPADLQTHFVYQQPAAGPDGITFGASGLLYVALAGANAMSVLDLEADPPAEVATFRDPVSNALLNVPGDDEIAYDLPASIAFNDSTRSILVTNQSFFAANADSWAVLDAFVDDTALPLVRPVVP